MSPDRLIRGLFKGRDRRPAAPRRRARPAFEALDRRQLLTAAGVSFYPWARSVEVLGSKADDQIDVRYFPDEGRLLVTATNASGTSTLSLKVNDPANYKVNIAGGDGNDTVTVDAPFGVGVKGNAGNDSIYGGSGNDDLYGQEGDDVVVGNGGDDTLDGGGGNDTVGAQWVGVGVVTNEPGNDTLVGGTGNDALGGGAGNDLVRGGDGNDAVRGDDGDDSLYGGAGDDSLGAVVLLNGTEVRRTENGDDLLDGGDGNDTLRGGDGDDLLDGGAGDDVLGAQYQSGQFVGEDGDDRLRGGAGNDQLGGGRGNDDLSGDAGNDRVSGGDGDDLYRFNAATPPGTDTLSELAGGGRDTLDFSAGAAGLRLYLNTAGVQKALPNLNLDLQAGAFEDVNGTGGDDVIVGNDLANRIISDGGNDLVYGQGGNDTVHAGGGNDTVIGGAGNDLLYGGAGDDRIGGGEDNDSIYGGAGDDVLGAAVKETLVVVPGAGPWGGGASMYMMYETTGTENGNDLIDGGDGDDTLGGGAGADTLYGRGDKDLIVGGDGDDATDQDVDEGDRGDESYGYGKLR